MAFLLAFLLSFAACEAFAPAPKLRTARQPTVSLSATTEEAGLEVGTAGLDWENLGFQYRETRGHVKMIWSAETGVWSPAKLVEGSDITMNVGATALHYGQACFEGLKAFAQPDGSVKLFRPQANAARLKSSCERIRMPPPSEAEFVEACKMAVRANLDYVPPYGSGGALYLRPLLIGTGPRIGLQPAEEYAFLVICTPVGDYYKGGLGSPVTAVVVDEFDRAAPRGVGNVKVAGNYAADLLPNMQAKANGFPVALYLDAQTRTQIEEFSTSNFIGVTKAGVFVTPSSSAILPSITNKSLQKIAEDMGMEVQERAINIEELADMKEAAACGTAVVITPVNKVHHKEKIYSIGDDEPGPIMTELYNRVRGIQSGDAPDKYGWTIAV